jgi:hypothetical protein
MLLGMLSGRIAKRLFRAIWGALDEHEPPKPTTEEASWPKAIGATALQALTFSLIRGALDRLGAQSFKHLTGIWPAEKRPKES